MASWKRTPTQSRRYCVLLHGKGLRLLNQSADAVPGGVYTWRVVEAENARDAAKIASTKLLLEKELQDEIWNRENQPIEVKVEETNETDNPDAEDTGYVFYYEHEDDLPYGAELG